MVCILHILLRGLQFRGTYAALSIPDRAFHYVVLLMLIAALKYKRGALFAAFCAEESSGICRFLLRNGKCILVYAAL